LYKLTLTASVGQVGHQTNGAEGNGQMVRYWRGRAKGKILEISGYLRDIYL
jgi:hypothetical protein